MVDYLAHHRSGSWNTRIVAVHAISTVCIGLQAICFVIIATVGQIDTTDEGSLSVDGNQFLVMTEEHFIFVGAFGRAIDEHLAFTKPILQGSKHVFSRFGVGFHLRWIVPRHEVDFGPTGFLGNFKDDVDQTESIGTNLRIPVNLPSSDEYF